MKESFLWNCLTQINHHSNMDIDKLALNFSMIRNILIRELFLPFESKRYTGNTYIVENNLLTLFHYIIALLAGKTPVLVQIHSHTYAHMNMHSTCTCRMSLYLVMDVGKQLIFNKWYSSWQIKILNGNSFNMKKCLQIKSMEIGTLLFYMNHILSWALSGLMKFSYGINPILDRQLSPFFLVFIMKAYFTFYTHMKVCSILWSTSLLLYFIFLLRFFFRWMSSLPFISWHISTTILVCATCAWTYIIIQTSILFSITVAVCVLNGMGWQNTKSNMLHMISTKCLLWKVI